ncbi:MvdC/MvdD family ATP grasp protein [Streptomyces sp. NPDC058417]|uniref:MvdC/MvdD family ATP grasp protein n=1 Tax=unclassified Streptomyces TaxID=2593676 RepID=UPI00364F3934
MTPESHDPGYAPPTSPRAGKPVATGASQLGPVCIITGRTDSTADRIILALERKKIPVLRFDLAEFPVSLRLSASVEHGAVTGDIASPGGWRVPLKSIRSILWWHPGMPYIPPGLPEPERAWARDEATAGLVGILASLDCHQVNHPARSQFAQNKAITLLAAVRSGLRVPRFWIGNSPRGAQEFASSEPVVCKSLVAPYIEYADGGVANFFTTPVKPSDLDESISLTAHKLQHEVRKRGGEIRLTVVGDVLFAARITAHSPESRRDFRADYAALSYESVDVPAPIRRGIARLMDRLGLTYAACDLLIDGEGHWWLVDVNTGGQYAWIEERLPDYQISEAIAQLLAHPPEAGQPSHSFVQEQFHGNP